MVPLGGLAGALPGKPDVVAQETGHGYVRAVITWPEGTRAKIDVHPERVYWYTLDGPKSAKRMQGVYDGASEFFASQGIHRFECSPRDNASKERLLKVAPWFEFVGEDAEMYLAVEF